MKKEKVKPKRIKVYNGSDFGNKESGSVKYTYVLYAVFEIAFLKNNKQKKTKPKQLATVLGFDDITEITLDEFLDSVRPVAVEQAEFRCSEGRYTSYWFALYDDIEIYNYSNKSLKELIEGKSGYKYYGKI